MKPYFGNKRLFGAIGCHQRQSEAIRDHLGDFSLLNSFLYYKKFTKFCTGYFSTVMFYQMCFVLQYLVHLIVHRTSFSLLVMLRSWFTIALSSYRTLAKILKYKDLFKFFHGLELDQSSSDKFFKILRNKCWDLHKIFVRKLILRNCKRSHLRFKFWV